MDLDNFAFAKIVKNITNIPMCTYREIGILGINLAERTGEFGRDHDFIYQDLINIGEILYNRIP